MASFPECTLCKKLFKWKGPDPYLLPCLHAVCETCLTSEETESRQCCKRNIMIKSLQKDRVRQRLILHLTAKHRPTELLCTHEDDGNQAICWCQECEEFLCEHCQNLHEGFKANKRHTVCGISEVGTSEDVEDSYCSIHSKYLLELFDKDCGLLICYKCKHGDHEGHSTEDLDTMSQKDEEELQNHIKVLTDVTNKTQERLNENHQEEEKLKESTTAQREMISHTFNSLSSMVSQREKEITQAFDTHLENAITTNSQRRSVLNLHHTVCSNILEYVQNIRKHAVKSDLPIIMSTIKATVKDCIGSDLHEKQPGHPTVTFLADDIADMKSGISTFSGISYNDTNDIPNAGRSLRMSYSELQEKCNNLKMEVESLKKTLEAQKTPDAMDDLFLQTAQKQFPPDAACHLLKSGLESIKTFIVQCLSLKLNKTIANTSFVSINDLGEMSNQRSWEYFGYGKLQQYMGTCSTIHLPQADGLQYWETKADVTLKQLLRFKELVLEIGICWKEERDESRDIREQPHSYSINVQRCQTHKEICTELRKEGDKVCCEPDALPHNQGLTTELHLGVAFDYRRRKIAFLDVKKGKVLGAISNVNTRKSLWPMFGVHCQDRGSVNMKLVVGKDITMSAPKKALIFEALYCST